MYQFHRHDRVPGNHPMHRAFLGDDFDSSELILREIIAEYGDFSIDHIQQALMSLRQLARRTFVCLDARTLKIRGLLPSANPFDLRTCEA